MTETKQQLLAEISNAAQSGYPFYVYTLADKAGVFYVGKGTKARLFQHQTLPKSDKNTAKLARIRASGQMLTHTIVAYFSGSEDALAHEATLIRDLDGLTNLALGDPLSPFEKAQLKAKDILDRIVPFEQWNPPAGAVEVFLKHLGLETPRQYYDHMIRELKAQIKDPSPTSIEFDRAGRVIRKGYNETHGEPFQLKLRTA